MYEVGKTEEDDIARIERFLSEVKDGRIKGWVIVAPLEGDSFKWWAGGQWCTTEMVGRLEVLQQDIVMDLQDAR